MSFIKTKWGDGQPSPPIHHINIDKLQAPPSRLKWGQVSNHNIQKITLPRY